MLMLARSLVQCLLVLSSNIFIFYKQGDDQLNVFEEDTIGGELSLLIRPKLSF